MRPISNSSKNSKTLKRAGLAVSAIATACALYVAAATVYVLPEMPKLADNFYASSPIMQTLGLSEQFPVEHPYLNSLLVQANWVYWAVISGQSSDNQYSHEWRLGDDTLTTLRTPAYGSSAVIHSSCHSGERFLFGVITQAAPGLSAKDAYRFNSLGGLENRGSRASWTQFTESHSKFALVTSRMLPWWHFPIQRATVDIPDKREVLAKEFPGLALDCAKAAQPVKPIDEVERTLLPELAAVRSKHLEGKPTPASVELGVIGLKDVKVTVETTPDRRVWLSAEAVSKSAAAPLQPKYDELVAKFAAMTPLTRVSTSHVDGKRSLLSEYSVKGGTITVILSQDAAESRLDIQAR